MNREVIKFFKDSEIQNLLNKLTTGNIQDNTWNLISFVRNCRMAGYSHASYDLDSNDQSNVIKILVASIPDLLDYVKEIPALMFIGCLWLTSFNIPKNIKSINAGAFESSSIQSVVLNPGLKEIGSSAFCGCQNLSGDIIIPDTVKTVGPNAFRNCPNITKIDFGNGIIADQGYASAIFTELDSFDDCFSLSEIILPSSLTDSYINIATFSELPLQKLDLPFEFNPRAKYLRSSSNWARICHINYPINFLDKSFANGNELVEAVNGSQTKLNIPQLYKIPNLLIRPNKRIPVDLVIRFSNNAKGEDPVFFTSIKDAEDFVTNVNNLGNISRRPIQYSSIYPARLQKKDYLDNFTLINTVAGPCLIQSPNTVYINQSNIIQRDVFK